MFKNIPKNSFGQISVYHIPLEYSHFMQNSRHMQQCFSWTLTSVWIKKARYSGGRFCLRVQIKGMQSLIQPPNYHASFLSNEHCSNKVLSWWQI